MKRLSVAAKRFLIGGLFSLLFLFPYTMVRAQDAESAIKQVLTDQVSAWNRGDTEAFMQGYKNSPETTFIGKTIQHGWQQVLERYKRGYPTKEAMGTLDFSDLNVRMLGADHAVVTGKFHLARSAAGGGDAKGVFSLVWEKTAGGWKIILDHTTSDAS
jgi:uncharacterized protein (TIGR02246 family)